MITMSSRVAATAFASLFLFASPVFAQTAAAPAAKTDTAAPAKGTRADRPRSAESMECSKQADEKGLKGRERRKFRRQCIRDARAAASQKTK